LYALIGGTAVQFVYGVVAARFTADIDRDLKISRELFRRSSIMK
jgi:hypothetical protein